MSSNFKLWPQMLVLALSRNTSVSCKYSQNQLGLWLMINDCQLVTIFGGNPSRHFGTVRPDELHIYSYILQVPDVFRSTSPSRVRLVSQFSWHHMFPHSLTHAAEHFCCSSSRTTSVTIPLNLRVFTIHLDTSSPLVLEYLKDHRKVKDKKKDQTPPSLGARCTDAIWPTPPFPFPIPPLLRCPPIEKRNSDLPQGSVRVTPANDPT
jgi:hypothetical protein